MLEMLVKEMVGMRKDEENIRIQATQQMLELARLDAQNQVYQKVPQANSKGARPAANT